MDSYKMALMEISDIQESADVLSIAMLNNPLHIAVFEGSGEEQRLEIKKMFIELFSNLPSITFLVKEHEKIVGVMRMKSCAGRKTDDEKEEHEDEIGIQSRKAFWLNE